eukprot:315534-Chlamydomonas_euryale.AAC.3
MLLLSPDPHTQHTPRTRVQAVGAPGSLLQSEAAHGRSGSPAASTRVTGAGGDGSRGGSMLSRTPTITLSASSPYSAATGRSGGGRSGAAPPGYSRATSRDGGADGGGGGARSHLSGGLLATAPASPAHGTRGSGTPSSAGGAAGDGSGGLPDIRASPGGGRKKPPPLITFHVPEQPPKRSVSIESIVGGTDDPTTKLAQLMAARTQMSRARMLDDTAPVSPGPLSRRL